MFALHETTQRRVCRVIFLVGCLVPTLLTLGWIAYWHRPWRQSDWQQLLTQQLHIRADIDEIVAPKPGALAIANLRLADLRTDKPLGSLVKLDIERQNSRLTFHAEHFELPAEQLPAFVSAVATWLAIGELEPFNVHIDRVKFTNRGRQAVHLQNLRIRSDLSHPAIQRFRLLANPADDQSKAIQLVLEQQDGHLRTKLDLQQANLPAWLIGKLVPGIGGCAEASFSGVITAENSDRRTQGNLQGRLDGVDLQQLAAATSPHRLQCLAQVRLEKLTWSDNIIELIQGKIEARGSAASYSLFHALADPKVFHCGVGQGWKNLRPASAEQLIAFDRLAVGFQMSEIGILLRGECADGALIVAPSGPLLFSSTEATPLPVASLVQLFHRPEKGMLPGTREAHEMARGLPLPRERAPHTEILKK